MKQASLFKRTVRVDYVDLIPKDIKDIVFHGQGRFTSYVFSISDELEELGTQIIHVINACSSRRVHAAKSK